MRHGNAAKDGVDQTFSDQMPTGHPTKHGSRNSHVFAMIQVRAEKRPDLSVGMTCCQNLSRALPALCRPACLCTRRWGGAMADNRISLMAARKPQATSLLDRARNGRRSALSDRMVTIVQTSSDGRTTTEHRFPAMPRIVDLLARLGGDACVVGLRTERLDAGCDARPTLPPS